MESENPGVAAFIFEEEGAGEVVPLKCSLVLEKSRIPGKYIFIFYKTVYWNETN